MYYQLKIIEESVQNQPLKYVEIVETIKYFQVNHNKNV